VRAAALGDEHANSRCFREQVGMTPAQCLSCTRLRRAQCFLETSRLTTERGAAEVGFGSGAVLRKRFGHLIVSRLPRTRERSDYAAKLAAQPKQCEVGTGLEFDGCFKQTKTKSRHGVPIPCLRPINPKLRGQARTACQSPMVCSRNSRHCGSEWLR
jgi:AraC-like DNA-binding protein